MPVSLSGSPPKVFTEGQVFPPKKDVSQFPPGWLVPVRGQSTSPERRDTSHKAHHFENPHVGAWTMDMKKEVELGLAPAEWSQTSQMNDPRPNGRAFFDARHINSPVARNKAGMKMTWDPQGLANAKADKRMAHHDVDPLSKDFKQGKIKGLSNEQLRDLITTDDFDVDVRAANAEARMSQVDSADADGGTGAHHRAGFGGVSYWT